MGTADYCMLVLAVFLILVVVAIKQDEQRKAERRQTEKPPPDGVEHRKVMERRARSAGAYLLWAARILGNKVRSRF